MAVFFGFIFSIAAGIVSHYICKWLDRKKDGNQPEDQASSHK